MQQKVKIYVPGVGVAMFIAGVPMGVFPGVSSGVEDPIWLAGVSSHRDFLLLAPGVGVSPTDSSPLSVRGVSAQPLPCPGVSLSVFGVSSQRFLRTLPVAPPWPGVAWPGVSLPGVAAPAGVWLGVGSHMRVLGVAPGVSLPLGRPGVSSHRLFEGVCAGVCPGVYEKRNKENEIKNITQTIHNFKIVALHYWIP